MKSREDYVRSAAKEGTVNIRERQNKERCPNCRGKHDQVYQYVEEHRGHGSPHGKDDRWFCLCGWTEVPSKGTTLTDWRTACLPATTAP